LEFWTRFAGCNARREETTWLFHGNDEQRNSAPAKRRTKTFFVPMRGIKRVASSSHFRAEDKRIVNRKTVSPGQFQGLIMGFQCQRNDRSKNTDRLQSIADFSKAHAEFACS